MIKGKKAIITGAAGFIGSSVMRYFGEMGFDCTGWDIAGDPDRGLITVDMCSLQSIESALDGAAPDVIVHCAGSANVGESIRNPDRDMALSVGVTHNLLFAMLHLGLNKTRLVYLSSASVYGNPETLPIIETAARNPVSPYALHKTMCEDICMYFIKNHGFDIKIARIFSAYGAGLRKQIFWDMHEKYVKTGRLDMFGTGEESRDFINIRDLEYALYLCATGDYPQNIINIANGREITIRRIAGIFAECVTAGTDSPEAFRPEDIISFNGEERPGDPRNWCADISVLKSLGYEQRVSIEQGVGDYIRWVSGQDS